ncbi:hypothetical protein SAMN05518672_102316 [Chitinophaga sp. CF118]|nr:hypothetical protein SAMN05518672_102316 [Chitinophaga sp. CF118]
MIPFTLRFKILDEGGKWTFYYLIASFFLAVASYLIGLIWRNNMWFLATMYFIQFLILSRFFQIVIKNLLFKRLITLTIIPIFIIFLVDVLKLEGLYAYNSYFATIRTLILIIYGAIYFWQLLKDEELVQKSVFINTLPNFWFNAAFFVYHSGSFMYSLSYNLLQQQQTPGVDTTRKVTVIISYFAGIIQLILLYIGLMKAKKKPL